LYQLLEVEAERVAALEQLAMVTLQPLEKVEVVLDMALVVEE
jgi:hypothetical protein